MTSTPADRSHSAEAAADCERRVREIHHRIKNNLQGLAGLLQQTTRRRPHPAAAMTSVAGQLHALAQVHGQQMRASGALPLGDLLAGLLADLSALHEAPLPFTRSGPTLARTRIGEADAVSVALVVAELAANAIVHALPGGTARAALNCDTSGAELVVANPGRLPVGFALDQTARATWGLGLAKALLPRRGATLSLVQVGDEVAATLRLAPPVVGIEPECAA